MKFENGNPADFETAYADFQDSVIGLSSAKMWLVFHGSYILLFFLILPIIFFERQAMLAGSQFLKPLFWGIFIGTNILGALFMLTRWDKLNRYYDRKGLPYFGKGFDDDTFTRVIQIPIACFFIVFSAFTILVGSLTFLGSTEKIETFDVVWKGPVSKQCRGYKTLPNDKYMKMHICKYPADFARTVNTRGTVTIRGYESPVGFRGLEIIDYKPSVS